MYYGYNNIALITHVYVQSIIILRCVRTIVDNIIAIGIIIINFVRERIITIV